MLGYKKDKIKYIKLLDIFNCSMEICVGDL